MKNTASGICAVALSLAAAGCVGGPEGDGQDVTSIEEQLSAGQNQGAFLTSEIGPTSTYTDPSEASREANTTGYYSQVKIQPDGLGSATISSALGSLGAFKSHYGFPSNEQVARYYNRGDLGLGREMHCIDRMNIDGQIVCYVANFAAGDANSEFTFGLSNNIAFANMDAGTPFATVAMVYRDSMGPLAPDKVFFVVYGADGGLANAATLDRHGITFENEFTRLRGNNPDPSFGTPGLTFNNHIPTNCTSCHGGIYNPNTHSEIGASLFLPFDLDQFDYENVPGWTRKDQLTTFRLLNEMVRKVAIGTSSAQGSVGASVGGQLDGWYHNTMPQSNYRQEVFETDLFDSTFVPSGWSQSGAGPSVYSSVVRGSCRTCHITNAEVHFLASESEFNSYNLSNLLCNRSMPHSLQSVRQFWQSTAPEELAAYWDAVGQGTQATTLRNCRADTGYVVTLDPPQILAATLPIGP